MMDPTEKKKIISKSHKAKSLANKSFVSGIPERKPKQNLKPKTQLNSQPQELAIVAMATGIVSLVFMCIPFTQFIGLFTAIPGIVLSSIALGKINKGEASGKGMAVAGLVTSIIALVISCFGIIFYFSFLGSLAAGI